MTIPELHALFLKFPTVSTDTRKITKGCIFFALKGDNFDGNSYASQALEKGAEWAVIDDIDYKKSNHHIVVEDVLTTLQKLATYHRRSCQAKVIALTGSNGKTTTKELIAAVLSKKYKIVSTKGNFNNHIGVPLTLLNIKQDTELAIIEMGANHQKEIAFLSTIAEPDFGYITNFGKAHLEGFGGVEGVIKGKSELYDYLMALNKSVFLNADDSIQLEKLGAYVKKFGFSTTNPHYYQIKFISANPFVRLEVEDLDIASQLIGSYNFTNCAIAVVMGKYFNVPLAAIKTAIEGYVPENNRSQIVKKNGHEIILDAYNANPTSMKAALENFSCMKGENKVVFLGDMFELGEAAYQEHQDIADFANKLHFSELYLIGENFNAIDTPLQTFPSFDTISRYLENNPVDRKCHILIKGSRGMALERLLKLL